MLKPVSVKIFISVTVSALICISIIEVAFRIIEYDFGGREASFDAIPIYYRQPTFPVGEVYFRRPGPDAWQGQVLATGLEALGGIDDAYDNEAAITVTYDEQGFRNPESLTDWDIVIVGDSFTELGHLPYEELYTTRIGKLLNVGVKNLGVSFTGPPTYNFYLKEYGKSESTRVAIMMFYEGNDLDNMLEENEHLETFKATGERPYRKVKQSSFVTELYFQYRKLGQETPNQFPKRLFQNAYYAPPTGKKVPITLVCAVPGKEQLTEKQLSVLNNSLSEWSDTARSLGMSPWLVYLPCKRRVLEGLLEFTEQTPQQFVDWRPTDLPELLKNLATTHGIKFIDTTPALASETVGGKLTHNTIFESHLNRHGSRVVSTVIANEISALD
jgi:hypothetical protein